ncbi:OST-HTH/LOTUS domain-containing protein [Thiolapillus sp.]
MYGIFPGQEIDWPNTPIVQHLFAAEHDYHEDGWTSLAIAIEFIRTKRPDLTPKKYHCGSWRHILHESKLFEIRKCRNDTAPTQVWYRSKPLPVIE